MEHSSAAIDDNPWTAIAHRNTDDFIKASWNIRVLQTMKIYNILKEQTFPQSLM
jgi:hypothetical protein